MNKKILAVIGTIVAIFVIGTMVYLFMPQTNNESNNNPSPIAQDNKLKQPSDDKKEEKGELPLTEKEAENVSSVDKNKIDAIEGFSPEELQEASKFITDYVYATYGNSYFMGGDWVKNGSKIKDVTNYMNAFYSYKTIDEVSKYEGKQNTAEFVEKVTSIIPFFGETEAYSPSKYCSDSYGTQFDENGKAIENSEIVDDVLIDCASDIEISEIRFTSVKDQESYYLRADFTVNAELALYSKELEDEAQTTAKYDYSLRLEEKILEDGTSEWEITGYNIKPSMSTIHAIDLEGNNG